MSRFGAKRVFKEEWKEGGLRGRRESGRECRRPAGRVSFSRYLETESELWEQIRVNAEKTSNFTFSLWQMHRCWKMVERRCEWMREIYSYLFSDRTMAKQSDVSCWWNANRIHFFLLIPSKKNIGSVVFPTSHNSFWLESHNQFWSLIYQVTPFNSFVAREDFFLKQLARAAFKLSWKVICHFIADLQLIINQRCISHFLDHIIWHFGEFVIQTCWLFVDYGLL